MLSQYFKREEFACKCGCGQDTVDAELITVLEDVRNHFNAPVIITPKGGNRCIAYNKAAGGKKHSRHLIGQAADIVVAGYLPIQIYSYLRSKYAGQYGIGSYKTFTHIDVRGWKARW